MSKSFLRVAKRHDSTSQEKPLTWVKLNLFNCSNIWDIAEKQLKSHKTLREAIETTWVQNMFKDFYKRLIKRMPRHLETGRKNNGGHTDIGIGDTNKKYLTF